MDISNNNVDDTNDDKKLIADDNNISSLTEYKQSIFPIPSSILCCSS